MSAGGTVSGKADDFHDADDKVFAAGQGLVVKGVAVLCTTVLQGAVNEQPHAVPAGERTVPSSRGGTQWGVTIKQPSQGEGESYTVASYSTCQRGRCNHSTTGIMGRVECSRFVS